MISLEKARALKDAGLQWEPKRGDWFSWRETQLIYDSYACRATAETEDCIWIPDLDQLLAELRKRGIMYVLEWSGGKHKIKISDGVWFVGDFEADTPEDTCADVLIWILGKE